VRGWSALHHQTALRLLAETERLEPDNPIAAMARTIFECAADEGVKPSGRRPGGANATVRDKRALRKMQKLAEYRRAAELYQTGLSLVDVGKALGHSPGWVSSALLHLDVATRPQGPRGPNHGTQDLARIERLRAMRADGLTLEQMGAAEQITRERVRQLCAVNGIDTSPNTDLDERQLQAVEAYMAGDSLELVAQTFEVGTSAVRNWLLKAGHVPRRRSTRRPSPKTKADASKAAQLYRQGVKGVAIAAELGLPHPEMIYRLLAIAGVRPNRNHGAGSSRRLS